MAGGQAITRPDHPERWHPPRCRGIWGTMSLDDLLRVLPILGFFAVVVLLQVWLFPRLGVPT